MKLILILAFGVAIVALLIQGQHRMIYHPRPYRANEVAPDNCRFLEYATGQGRQVSYYILPPEREEELPDRIWLMFGGNASLALDWLELIRDFPDRRAGFILLEYPGYGRCRGRVSPETMMESAAGAISALATHLNAGEGAVRERLSLVGHSLGAAAALLFGSRNRVDRIVLIAPFTSLRDMATLVVGKPLDRTLVHRFDNRARLGEVLAVPEPPIVTIIHGDRDKVIPVRMGRELAASSPAIRYYEERNGDHNYILVTARKEIIAGMINAPTGPERE
ncbi:MAG: alpha/beta hydrolase [Proteobacteria bacterium]|nr:alpha/beta hydrolase [Pseudomonadota bacterium]MBU1737462.1 alpha/beta hydrolase [Pseudomonadota bacterium]